VVPQEAVAELQGNYQVAVVDENNRVTIRPVTVGDRFGAWWEITDGLKPGEKVIVQGAQKVQDGVAVVTKPWTPPQPTATPLAADPRK
ncbi:MAG: efflux transporter periplasmic adaptor subunit, partial [Chthoniobacterales bacterium]|nr:efflux transporter periplasmic adaptor subunit [Chthoniobacterales bacterium]